MRELESAKRGRNAFLAVGARKNYLQIRPQPLGLLEDFAARQARQSDVEQQSINLILVCRSSSTAEDPSLA